MDPTFPPTFLDLTAGRRVARADVAPAILLAIALPVAFGVLMAIADIVR